MILLPESYDVYTLWVLKQIATEAMESIDFRKMIHPYGTVIFHRKQPVQLPSRYATYVAQNPKHFQEVST